jgi:hypothetical protein
MANDPPTSLGMRFGWRAHREANVPFRNPRPISQVNFLARENKATREMRSLARDYSMLRARFTKIALEATAQMYTRQDTLSLFRKAVTSALRLKALKDKIRAAQSAA